MTSTEHIVKSFFQENATLETVIHLFKIIFVVYISYIVLYDNIISPYFYLILGLGNLMNSIKFYYSYKHCGNIDFLYTSYIGYSNIKIICNVILFSLV